MATKLDKELKREVDIDGVTHTIVISPDRLKITPKRGRKAIVDTTWKAMVLGGIGE